MFVTLGLGALGALGAYGATRVFGAKAVDAWLEYSEGKQRREAALGVGDLGLMLQYTDFEFLEIEGRSILMNRAEYQYFAAVTPNDWLDPSTIRLFGEVLSQQEDRVRRVEEELARLSEEEFQDLLDSEKAGVIEATALWFEEKFRRPR